MSKLDLTDSAGVIDFLDVVLPPLPRRATFVFVPASGNRSTTGSICLVDDMPERVTSELAHAAVSTAAHTAESIEEDPSVLLALHRRGDPDLREADVLWVDAARRACAEHEVRLLGVWLKVGRGEAVRLDAALPTA